MDVGKVNKGQIVIYNVICLTCHIFIMGHGEKTSTLKLHMHEAWIIDNPHGNRNEWAMRKVSNALAQITFVFEPLNSWS
jgi:hypothetical protein